MMTTRELTLGFLAPAFLGGARQSCYWRAPPFKALLRRWWRVAWAARHGAGSWESMRKFEGELFGHARVQPLQQEGRARQSQVRLRLEPWGPGQRRPLPRTRPVGEGKQSVASAVYLGYGPVRQATEWKMQHPIAPDGTDVAKLTLAFPEEKAALIDDALYLIHAFGTVGGRASNGWGSVFVDPKDGALRKPKADFVRNWELCLKEEWPHAIGSDGRPLVWATVRERHEWNEVIEDLAQVRKDINRSARGNERMVLNQPAGRKGGRMPSPLRFKIQRTGSGRLRGLIYHMPHTPPPLSAWRRDDLCRIWSRVHERLDENLPRFEV